MAELPDTQLSLILRLPATVDRIDQCAWQEFVQIYEPFIYSYARRRGLQDSDAHELIQRVMIAVAKSIQNWTPPIQTDKPEPDDPTQSANLPESDSHTRFRNWLFTIARTQLINIVKSTHKNLGVGGTTQLLNLQSSVDPSSTGPGRVEDDVRYEMFLWAATQVKQQVEARTWQAFWRTAVLGENCREVAAEVNLSVGSVYAARSRVLQRIKHEVQRLDTTDVPSQPARSILGGNSG